MKKVTILGSGESGVGAALLAKAKNYDVFVSEKNKIEPHIKELFINNGISFEEGGHSFEIIINCDFIIKSPGISNKLPLIKELNKAQKNIIGEIEFAFNFISAPIIAITGTNGKSTVTKLIGHILQQANYNVSIGGNVGNSICKEVLKGNADLFVIEISNFQLEDIKNFKPNIALILNIQEDHLDSYDYNINNYADVKMSILKNMTQEDHVIFPIDDKLINERIDKFNVIKHPINTSSLKDLFYFGNRYKLKGTHNYINILFAKKVAELMNIDSEILEQAIHTFKGLEHRLEFVKKLNGIYFYNDSKATTVDSVLAALNSFDKNIIWIAGGIDKGNDYSKLKEIVQKKVKALICLGKDCSNLKMNFNSIIVLETQSMALAVKKALEIANNGDIVLLSPACSSFDLFKNFEHRGTIFKQEVEKLLH